MENWVYKNVLVISDNLAQCKRFYSLLQAKDFKNEVNFNWSCSSYSDPNMFSEIVETSFTTLNLKQSDDLNNICRQFDLVISIHCKQIFPPQLVSSVKCINVHPGYNPVNRGWYPQVFAIINQTVFGATIHEIDNELDHGPIIDRIKVEQFPWDTSLELYERVLEGEMVLLERNIEKILQKTYNPIKPEGEGKVYLKKDFRELCNLDLEEEGKFLYFINKLRALSHGAFRNAYFIDKNTGKKIFINVRLQPEELGLDK